MAFSPDTACRLIRRSWEQGRLAHAYLISATRAEDLEQTAARLACMVNDWPEEETLDGLRKHGAAVLQPESKLRQIRIEPVRDAIRALQYTATGMKVKILILADADRLTPQAANAFLKTLEEPPPDTLILLLSRAPGQLLETILSRCVRVPLYRPAAGGLELSPPQESLVRALAGYFSPAEKLSTARAMGLLQEFQGIMTRIRGGIEEENREAFREEQQVYGKSTDGAWLKEREDYYDDLTESACQEQRMALMGLLFTWLGEILRRRHGLAPADLPGFSTAIEQAAARLPDSDLHRRLRALEELRRNLTTNVRDVLALEVGFLKAFA